MVNMIENHIGCYKDTPLNCCFYSAFICLEVRGLSKFFFRQVGAESQFLGTIGIKPLYIPGYYFG